MTQLPHSAAVSPTGRRVVLTGLGILSPIGVTCDAVCAHLQAPCHPEEASASAIPNDGFLGHLKGWEPESDEKLGRLSVGAQYAVQAAVDACGQARLDSSSVDTARVAVLMGTMFSSMAEVVRIKQLLESGKVRRAGVRGTTKLMNSGPAVNIAASLGLRGPVMSNSTGFASGMDNIGCAYEWVRDGHIDIAVCGASEENCAPFLGKQFTLWERSPRGVDLNREVTIRPFDARREGSILSAGSGVVVLESAKHALRRGARPLAEICGYASCFDVEPGPDSFSTALTRAIERVCRHAEHSGVNRLRQVVSGAAGFHLADADHVLAIRNSLGMSARVTSTAGWLGHGLAVSSAWNVVLASLMLSNGFLIRCRGLTEPGADCRGVEYVMNGEIASDPGLLITAGGLGFASCLALQRLSPMSD
ncbi:3-oxoacyl-[acyl-carrier-protein] synthase 2 [Planctopirus ephydatiae]|uniref:3-oxoacyl-[acyl-carrier-protein] synthase 2 n=1 Tax=Planctopirus ephydatiae TaxID=2528019 RepID=A0A518GTE7_9PLAN|nr:beta-ketoacyl synthase N-terminal-like domain-containing protein [Planctopirus ephydatiae]QDV31865.1 3-oxoacyl-[acyl-carrier-protein] synthase 2 [Planctopirus ephydatiae]